jgi:hypothetical protein
METDREIRERLRLVASIKEEIEKQDALKSSILQELGQTSRFKRLSHHPASLVVLTFALTTGLGSWLTSRWQRVDQKHQSLLQTRQRAYEQKYQVATETAKAIGEIHAATTAVLSALQIDNYAMRRPELKRTVPKWRIAKNEWLVNQAVLTGKIAANFQDQSNDVIQDFDEIFYSYKSVNVDIGNVLEDLQNNHSRFNAKMKANITKQLETINTETRDKTKTLIEKLTVQLNPN